MGASACLQGVWLRDYTPVEERQGSDPEFAGETLGRVRPSNAYQRRIAGVTTSNYKLSKGCAPEACASSLNTALSACCAMVLSLHHCGRASWGYELRAGTNWH